MIYNLRLMKSIVLCIGLIVGVLCIVESGYGLDRCKKYYSIVRKHSIYYFGITARVDYFMGQVEQESACNEGITAFDGGMGLMQLMPGTVKQIQKDWVTQFNPYDVNWNIRAGIYWDKKSLEWVKCKDYYFMFRAYNGGAGNLNKEIDRAGSCIWVEVEKKCKRGGVMVKNRYLDFCKVNIEYPYSIFRKAQRYSLLWG